MLTKPNYIKQVKATIKVTPKMNTLIKCFKCNKQYCKGLNNAFFCVNCEYDIYVLNELKKDGKN